MVITDKKNSLSGASFSIRSVFFLTHEWKYSFDWWPNRICWHWTAISWLPPEKKKKNNNHNDKRIFIIYDFLDFPIAIFALSVCNGNISDLSLRRRLRKNQRDRDKSIHCMWLLFMVPIWLLLYSSYNFSKQPQFQMNKKNSKTHTHLKYICPVTLLFAVHAVEEYGNH